ncbi:MAG: hypothetical protein ACRDOI_34095 [Trebonia sp.]
MTSSATAIWIICVVVVAGLAIWLGSVALAARKPYQEHARGGRLRGTAVQGGMHVGAGRSVAPRRDESATPREVRGGDTLHPGTEASGADTESMDARERLGTR